MLVNPAFCGFIDIETDRSGAADGNVALACQKFDMRILLQFAIDGFLRRGGEVENGVFLFHYSEHAQFRKIVRARCKSHIYMFLQEL